MIQVEAEVVDRARLISTLFRLPISDVLENALICYADKLRIHEEMLKEFPITEKPGLRWASQVESVEDRYLRKGLKILETESKL